MSLPPDDYGIVFHYHLFTLESRVFLYSVDFEVEVGAEGEEETIFERCIVAFLGEDYELVAHTNVHRYDFCMSWVLSMLLWGWSCHSEGSQIPLHPGTNHPVCPSLHPHPLPLEGSQVSPLPFHIGNHPPRTLRAPSQSLHFIPNPLSNNVEETGDCLHTLPVPFPSLPFPSLPFPSLPFPSLRDTQANSLFAL